MRCSLLTQFSSVLLCSPSVHPQLGFGWSAEGPARPTQKVTPSCWEQVYESIIREQESQKGFSGVPRDSLEVDMEWALVRHREGGPERTQLSKPGKGRGHLLVRRFSFLWRLSLQS